MKKTVLLLIAVLMAISIMIATPSQGASVPLPEDIKIAAPASDVPPEIAAFSGKWEGDWDGVLDAVLIVTEINRTEATVIYAWGDAPEWNTKKDYLKHKAIVTSGEKPKIKFFGGSRAFTFEMRKDLKTLNAEVEWRGQISETKFKKVN
ncbi:MAG: hypothetical protein M1147_05655 [Nitrospirae bacterium]|nr:hypothetical protein [Nitrospirota bacterium]MCL5977603.1 hypothetical protein [Nitrospirota bacterium]